MATERTLVLVKPDGVRRGLAGEVIGRLESKGLTLVAMELRTLDRATAEVFRGAEGKALYERWFLQPIPPRGLTLNVPMSPALARSYAAPSDAADPAHYGS